MSRAVWTLVAVWAAFTFWVVWSVIALESITRSDYTVQRQEDGYDIRFYPAHLDARVRVTGPWESAVGGGARALLGYIRGDNTTQDSLASGSKGEAPEGVSVRMAAAVPVTVESVGDAYLVSAVIPGRYTDETIPRPDDPQVRLVPVASSSVAVLSFNGWVDHGIFTRREAQLRDLLSRDKQSILSSARLVQYGPAWAPPFLQRNEIIFTIR